MNILLPKLYIMSAYYDKYLKYKKKYLELSGGTFPLSSLPNKPLSIINSHVGQNISEVNQRLNEVYNLHRRANGGIEVNDVDGRMTQQILIELAARHRDIIVSLTITNNNVNNIPDLPNLQELTISNNTTINTLPNLQKLRTLTLNNTNINTLPNFPILESLILDNVLVEFLPQIQNLQNLQSLTIQGVSRFNLLGADPNILNSSSLTILTIIDSDITMQNLPNLQNLSIINSSITLLGHPFASLVDLTINYSLNFNNPIYLIQTQFLKDNDHYREPGLLRDREKFQYFIDNKELFKINMTKFFPNLVNLNCGFQLIDFLTNLNMLQSLRSINITSNTEHNLTPYMIRSKYLPTPFPQLTIDDLKELSKSIVLNAPGFTGIHYNGNTY